MHECCASLCGCGMLFDMVIFAYAKIWEIFDNIKSSLWAYYASTSIVRFNEHALCTSACIDHPPPLTRTLVLCNILCPFETLCGFKLCFPVHLVVLGVGLHKVLEQLSASWHNNWRWRHGLFVLCSCDIVPGNMFVFRSVWLCCVCSFVALFYNYSSAMCPVRCVLCSYSCEQTFVRTNIPDSLLLWNVWLVCMFLSCSK